MRKNRKAQIRMSETIAVLFIFFILIVFGLIFYMNYTKVALKEKQQELLAGRAIDTTVKALFLPELICSRGEVELEDNCFDLMKLRHIEDVFSKDQYRDYIFNLFSYANITVHPVLPMLDENGDGEAEYYTIYERELPGYTQKEPTFFIVSLRDVDESYGYGYIKVEVFSS